MRAVQLEVELGPGGRLIRLKIWGFKWEDVAELQIEAVRQASWKLQYKLRRSHIQ